ncbi:DUF779 domain-containing protein [Sulfoacidibacillus thermotolerans]|uniref:Acetaldehyde dehydrogenase n=1 Tax=Sulfoacidibacillus thermotolerans TaxID=1765684 RepID=A0A2U3D999_SULT2|nr:DUF779 domain-containing protein [Sulfoacidibacillus thermotolerans]PWI57856.1 acetaldehyde dehydrogenase [Sulfoacidibacillus thermotolerans]
MDTRKVTVTDAAAALIEKLITLHGSLMFHQSGGCCDGSAPMCYPQGEFQVGEQDVLLGEIANCPFYIGRAQYKYWKKTQIIVDAIPGRGAGFSLESPEGMRFISRSRSFTPDEWEELIRMDSTLADSDEESIFYGRTP